MSTKNVRNFNILNIHHKNLTQFDKDQKYKGITITIVSWNFKCKIILKHLRNNIHNAVMNALT